MCFRVQAPPGDRNPADNLREADIEIVDRKNHVLLLAGGPTREYQFLRNQLFRDRSTTLDVLLQSGKPGMSQEAKKILDDFPATREEMYDYDCVVAFDPNWQALSAAQVELLEKWVGEQGGGLIVDRRAGVCRQGRRRLDPGPGHDARSATCTPSSFPAGWRPWKTTCTPAGSRGRWSFTREGLEADFLWLADTATASRQAWAGFPGVYSYCPVRGPKPGATVFARFSDPAHRPGRPAAGLFRRTVLRLGERVLHGQRRDVAAPRGRRGVLRAVLHEADPPRVAGPPAARLQPRRAAGRTGSLHAGQHGGGSGPTDQRPARTAGRARASTCKSSSRTGRRRPLRCGPIRAGPGAYLGQFPALQEGTYRLELPVPESDNERLSRRIQVKVPDLERENPRRNDALLSAIAKRHRRKVLRGHRSGDCRRRPNSLVDQLKDRTSTVILTAAPTPNGRRLGSAG